VGFEAIDNCERPTDLREDFKIEIGSADPLKLAQSGSGGDAASRRSTLGIAKDFFDAVVGEALGTIERQGFERPSRILIAEPLSLAHEHNTHDDWLRNYRRSIRQILAGKFAEIDFMPEPFAAFQYYRYGGRHALVAQKQKHIALVFDFGGGTFDSSVIETTSDGDISRSGRNSKPLAARSIPVGGFYINRMIGEQLLFRAIGKGVDKQAVRRALDSFTALKNMDEEDLKLQRTDHASLARNFRRLLQSVEQAKITICGSITDWRLNADLTGSPACRVEVPQFPLAEDSPVVPIRLEASELRSLYEERIWKQKLLPAIRDTLRKAEAELDGRPITIVLLSGGSSNIRWLKPLIERDLPPQLREAEIIELSENYQEIVSKGLAVECARRYYTEGQGDFRAVTYNRLCLGLDPNSSGLELRKFAPETGALKDIETDAGVLLPSSTSLKGLVGRPLRWRVRLSKLPTRTLDYFFMRSSFDPDQVDARQNLHTRLATPKAASFSRNITLELVIREDGTAEPAFVYDRGSQDERGSTRVQGQPFYLDMTFAAPEAGVETYLGFDFGTSTSSLCYVNANDIRVYSDRARDSTWMGLGVLKEVLPYPAAYPLARFLSETSAEQMEHWGREALEGMLTVGAYLTFAEHCTLPGSESAHFKGLRRSAGPLWGLMKNCARSTGAKWELTKDLAPLTVGANLEELDDVVSQLARPKHGKRADINYPRMLEKFGNALARVLNKKAFGFFEDARRKPFSKSKFQGVFRNARGPAPPFVDVLEYEGSEDFASEFVFLIDIELGRALPLFPMFVRGLDKARGPYSDPEFFMYDIARFGDREIAFKAVQDRDEVGLIKDGPFPEVFEATKQLLDEDAPISIIDGINLWSRSLSEKT
jgi:hypothetical protein